MNILITAPNLIITKNVSGIAAVVNTIMAHNREHEYQHYLLGSPDNQLNKFQWVFELTKQLLKFPLYLKKNKIDLVHQNLPFNPKGITREYIINLWCRLTHVPVFLHIHGGVFLMKKTTNPIYIFFANSIFRNSKTIVVLSEYEKITLERFYKVQNVDVLNNSVDFASFKIDSRSYNPKNPKLLFLGRIHESKGIDDIYEALKLLNCELNFTFTLCGTGPLKWRVQDFESLLGSKFRYMGIVSGDVKNEIIKSSDFFLLPSRYGEGLPMALLESMAAGVVPLVTDDASMKYVVQQGVNGYKVEKRNPSSIFTTLKEAIIDIDTYHHLSNNASLLISENYDIELYNAKLNALYSKIFLA